MERDATPLRNQEDEWILTSDIATHECIWRDQIGSPVLDISPRNDVSLTRARPAAQPPKPAGGALPGRLLRAGFALAVLGTTLHFIHDRFFVTASDVAIMAGRTIVLRAPIDGRVVMSPWSHGQNFAEGHVVAQVVNDRADTQRLDELQTALATVEGEIPALEQRAAGTAGLLNSAILSAEAFRRIRLDQLRPRIAEAEAVARAAAARLKEAEAAAARGEALQRGGYTSAAAVDVLRRDLAVARDGLRAATERRTALLAEQEGASLGVYATDNATDRSISQQTTDRLTLTLVEVDAMLAERRARRAAIQQQLDAERQRVGLLREAPLRAPIGMVLVQLLAQPGEFVRPGQDVARFASCGERLVRTEVEERVFRTLAIGQRASFRPAGAPAKLPGEIVELVPTSLQPGAPRMRPQAVVQLGGSEGVCETGRSGAVRFD